MSAANLQDLEVLGRVKQALAKFMEQAAAALGDVESDVRKTMNWLDAEAEPHWKRQMKLNQENLNRAKEKLREKQIYKDPSGARQSFIDEIKQVRKCEAQLEEAERKLVATRQHKRLLQNEWLQFKGLTQPLQYQIADSLPTAVSRLTVMQQHLQEYLNAAPPEAARSTPADAASEEG